jgi:hypothetical protein
LTFRKILIILYKNKGEFMLKNIRLCLLVSIISLHLSFPSLAMNNDQDQDQEIRNRITSKIAKYEVKIRDLTRFLGLLQINGEDETPVPTTPPREIVIDLPVPTTPLHAPLPIPHPVTEITEDQIRTYLQEMYDSGNHTYADIGVLLGYEPDKLADTPDGKSTGKTAVRRFLEGHNSQTICNRFRERVRNGNIHFPAMAVIPLRDGLDAHNEVQMQQATLITPPVTPTTGGTTLVRRSPATPITLPPLPRAATSTMRGTAFVTPPPTQYAVGGQPYDPDNDPLYQPFDFSPHDPKGDLRDYERGIRRNTWKGADPSSSDED